MEYKWEHEISAGVVMYGDADETHDCLVSLAQQTKSEGFTVYFIDNASPEGALDTVLKKGLPQCVVNLPQKENRGYGAGHNAVIPLLKSKYHAVVNPDILLHSDVLSEMAAWMDKHPEVAIVCPRLVFPDGREQHVAKRRPALLPLIARQFNFKKLKKYEENYLMLDEDLSVPTEVEFCSGSFFLIRSELYVEMGGFDEKYFMYVEDADISQKALQYGRAMYLPQVCVTHAWHRDAHRNLRKLLWQTRSMLRYFGKWGFRLK